MASLPTAFTLPAEPVAACAAVTPACSSPGIHDGIHDVTADVTMAKDPLEDDSLDLVEQLSPGNLHKNCLVILICIAINFCKVIFSTDFSSSAEKCWYYCLFIFVKFVII